ncbi:TlpA disulfide reductase family protein [uncultured Psychroserpens sp.]|uniref:TlpA family protein disulfide reductase n=1 Tax=uncultured Psychroserpens sp. TaxID=255436 RepID=UPI00261C12D4|nr:TlpA disulfide reductase family protein [uncultured Psychroserpens sp.]
MKVLKIVFYLFTFLGVSSFSYSQETAEEILEKSNEICKTISSIEYTIHQKGAPGKFGYGMPKIEATIIQKKDSCLDDIGFDKALIKATGIITENRNEKPFSFSYDGEDFMYQIGKKARQKSISGPTRNVTMGKLQQHLFMMRIFPFAEEDPYKMISGKGKVDIKLITTEEKDGHPCNKIETSVTFKAPNGKEFITKNIWWISELDCLPRAYSDGFIYKDITLKKINYPVPNSFFTLTNKNLNTDYLTGNQAENELAKANLLPIGKTPTQWSAKDQFGKTISSKQLQGKVVLLDFWGSWCTPCIQAMPDIQKLQDHYKHNPNVIIIGISAGERDKEAALKLFKEKGYNYTHIPNGDDIAKSNYKVKEYPSLYILDKHGKIASAEKGYHPNSFERWKTTIDKLIE